MTFKTLIRKFHVERVALQEFDRRRGGRKPLTLKVRGVQDILIAVADGLKGIPEALGAVFVATTLQTCIVHLTRNSLEFASWKDRRGLAAAIKPIYTAASAEATQAELDAFEQSERGQKSPTVVVAWRRACDRVIPFFAFPPAVRKVIYTTNSIESVNAGLTMNDVLVYLMNDVNS